MLIVLLALTAVMFLLQKVSPFDPVRLAVGPEASPAVVAAARKRLGYDDPIVVQYVHYIEHAVTGSLGTSLNTGDPVTSDISSALPASLELMLAAILIATPLALLIGVASAARWKGATVIRVPSSCSPQRPRSSSACSSCCCSTLACIGCQRAGAQAPGAPRADRQGVLTSMGCWMGTRGDLGCDSTSRSSRGRTRPGSGRCGRSRVAWAPSTNMRAEHARAARARGSDRDSARTAALPAQRCRPDPGDDRTPARRDLREPRRRGDRVCVAGLGHFYRRRSQRAISRASPA